MLDLTDIQSATWQKMRAHIQARIDLLRKQNDNDADQESTAKLRGRIAELKKLLGTAEPKRVEVTE